LGSNPEAPLEDGMKVSKPKIIKFESRHQVTEMIEEHGDLRRGDGLGRFEALKGDDYGLYQQACLFLLAEIHRLETDIGWGKNPYCTGNPQ
jgi:hypothetical protein